MIEAFSGIYLSPRYDQPQPTPDFHREAWGIYCSSAPAAAIAAPRNHAKSTSLTHDYILANVLFRQEDYVILVGASEEKAIEHLGDITKELQENDALIEAFKIKCFIQEQKADIIVECLDGHQFRIVARGAEQKIRGTKWRGKRPGLIVGDDLEDDEQVENKDRRKKFRRWFFRACKQALRDRGRIRCHGTILHKDSLLSHLMRNRSWCSKRYKAHRAFSDFSEILWPEKFPPERLKQIRQEFIDEGDSAGYSQEYLNDPKDDEGAYLLPEQFISLKEEELDEFRRVAVGCDFAVSSSDAANRTAFVIGGKTLANKYDILDVRKGRWSTKEWIDEMFDIQEQYNPEFWFVEGGVIWKAVEPMLNSEMQDRDIWMNFVVINPTKDKATMGRPLQKVMKARAVRHATETSWFPEYKEELLDFSETVEATLDDQFDAAAKLIRGLMEIRMDEEDAMDEDERDFNRQAAASARDQGRSSVTGY
jgi:predicted phage terminase large subunit-like protein